MFDISNWRDNLFPIVKKWFDDRYDKRTGLIPSVIGVEGTDRYSFDEYGVGGFGEVPKYDGSNIDELTRAKGFKTTYTTEEYAGKCNVAFKAAKFDLSGQAKKAGKFMADALAMTQLMDYYRLFANGFNSTYVGGDAKSLFATDHPLNDDTSDTYSNSGTTVFSISAITATQTAAMRFKTYDGLPFAIDMNFLMVSPELEPLCRQYFGKEAKHLPGGDYNDANPVYETRYTVNKLFTAKQWCIGDALMMKDYIKLVNGTAPMVIPQKSSNPLIQEFIGYMDYTMGWSEPKVIFGHNPA